VGEMKIGPDWVGLEPDYNDFLIFEFDPVYKSCQKLGIWTGTGLNWWKKITEILSKLYYYCEKNYLIFCKGFYLDLDSHLKLFFIMDEYGLSFKISGKDPDRKIRQCAHLWCMAVSAHTQGCHVKKTNPNLRMYVKDS